MLTHTVHINVKEPGFKKSSILFENLLWQYQQANNKKVFLKKNTPYIYDTTSGPITLILDQDVIIRWKKKNGRYHQFLYEPHCYVLGKKLNTDGGQNEGLFEIEGTLTFTQEKRGFTYHKDQEKNKKRLLKIEKHIVNQNVKGGILQGEDKKIKNILKIAEQYPPLHAKHVREPSEGVILSYTKMRSLGNKNLANVLQELASGSFIIRRLQLTYFLLLELKQLQAYQIVHRDIKPGNITEAINHLYFVDFGSAKYKNISAFFSYTPQYASPELIDGNFNKQAKLKADYQSDIFQTGLTLSEIWGASTRHEDEVAKIDPAQCYEDNNIPPLEGLFTNIPIENDQELLNKIKLTLQPLIIWMVQPNLEKRMKPDELDQAIATVSGLFDQLMLNKPIYDLPYLSHSFDQDHHSRKTSSQVTYLRSFLCQKYYNLSQIIDLLIQQKTNNQVLTLKNCLEKTKKQLSKNEMTDLKKAKKELAELQEIIQDLINKEYNDSDINFLFLENRTTAINQLKNLMKEALLDFMLAASNDQMKASRATISKIIIIMQNNHGSPHTLLRKLTYFSEQIEAGFFSKRGELKKRMEAVLSYYHQLYPSYFGLFSSSQSDSSIESSFSSFSLSLSSRSSGDSSEEESKSTVRYYK